MRRSSSGPGNTTSARRLSTQGSRTTAGVKPWRHLKIKAELARGRDKEAMAALEEALRRFPASISLHLLGSQVYRQNGHAPEAAAELDAIARLIQNSPRRYATRRGFGHDRTVLPAARRRCAEGAGPVLRRRHQASTWFRRGLFRHGRAGPGQGGLRPGGRDAAERPPRGRSRPAVSLPAGSRSRAEDRHGTAKALAEALKINPRHVDSLLLAGRPADRRRALRRGRTRSSSRSSTSIRASRGPSPTRRCWRTFGTTSR